MSSQSQPSAGRRGDGSAGSDSNAPLLLPQNKRVDMFSILYKSSNSFVCQRHSATAQLPPKISHTYTNAHILVYAHVALAAKNWFMPELFCCAAQLLASLFRYFFFVFSVLFLLQWICFSAAPRPHFVFIRSTNNQRADFVDATIAAAAATPNFELNINVSQHAVLQAR